MHNSAASQWGLARKRARVELTCWCGALRGRVGRRRPWSPAATHGVAPLRAQKEGAWVRYSQVAHVRARCDLSRNCATHHVVVNVPGLHARRRTREDRWEGGVTPIKKQRRRAQAHVLAGTYCDAGRWGQGTHKP